jgi:3-deoxy-D-manno-octulosonate 8-phosphate phosphatase (KDO 8-P phosphatase)
MPNFKDLLPKVKAMVFDVDGVLSTSAIPLFPNGEQVRMINTKDGYALRLASKKGFILALITGGNSEAIHKQYTHLGFNEIYMKVPEKIEKLNELMSKYDLNASEILYMGDDIPDYEVMSKVGVPVCPADAASEIKDVSVYVSDKNGGQGCVRDVVEQALKAHCHWMSDAVAFGW